MWSVPNGCGTRANCVFFWLIAKTNLERSVAMFSARYLSMPNFLAPSPQDTRTETPRIITTGQGRKQEDGCSLGWKFSREGRSWSLIELSSGGVVLPLHNLPDMKFSGGLCGLGTLRWTEDEQQEAQRSENLFVSLYWESKTATSNSHSGLL